MTPKIGTDFRKGSCANQECHSVLLRVQEDARRCGEQRILHLLAQGGRIEIEKNESRKIAVVRCLTRDGWRYPDFDLELFRKLRRKKAVSSTDGGPYRITRRGLELVRAELDNR